MKEELGMLALFAAGVTALFVGISRAGKEMREEERKQAEILEEGRRITERDGVIKVGGRFYAYCPKCGRKCGYPQRVIGNGPNPNINTCTFRCYTCNEDFVKQYDYRLV